MLPLLSMLLAAAPSPAPPATIGAEEVTAPGPSGPLGGLMTRAPRADAPIILIIPGSGPTDRDGNAPAGLRAATYRLLAEGLAARGVSTVRIDKRGLYSSAAATPDANAVTIDAYAEDAHRWIDAIRARTGAPCLWLLGHSEGGLVALAAAREPEGICGLILAAAPGRPLGDIVKEQLRANGVDGPLLDQALSAIDALAAGRHVDTTGMAPALLALFRPAVQDLLISEMALDPAKLAAAVTRPMLILQGGRDLQLSVADAERLKAAAPAARLVVAPDANHVLKSVPTDDRGANLATYGLADLPLAPGVVDAIAGFVTAR